MADPLKLLQECATGKRELRELIHAGKLYYVFGDVAYPHDAKTNLSVYNKLDEYYSIESILYLWRSRDVHHTAYVKDVSGKGIQAITRMQRRELMDYLKGELTTLPKANVLAPIPTPIPVSRLTDVLETVRKKPKIDNDQKGQRIDKILDQASDQPDTALVRGLSNELSAEKVAQLRTRVKKNLKNMVKPIEDENFSSDIQIPDASADAISKFLIQKERTWKNRITCLEAQNKDFSSILSVLNNLKTRESKAKKANNVMLGAGNQPNMIRNGTRSNFNNVSQNQQNGRPVIRQSLNTGYSRYDQEIFQKDPIAEFQIETDLSFHGTSFRHIRDANKPLSASQLQQQSSSTNQQQKLSGAPTTQQIPSVVFQQQLQKSQMQKRTSRTPIIVIPASGTALITMYNAMDILQDLRFVSTEEKKAKQCRRENEVLLQIRKSVGTVPYRVIDNPLKLKEEDWDRVVAVFVQGPAWQFKGWNWGGNPVEIFTNLAAFHLKFEEQKLDPNVAKWSVNILSLSKTKRHLDRAILHKFWDILERHIAKTKPYLRF